MINTEGILISFHKFCNWRLNITKRLSSVLFCKLIWIRECPHILLFYSTIIIRSLMWKTIPVDSGNGSENLLDIFISFQMAREPDVFFPADRKITFTSLPASQLFENLLQGVSSLKQSKFISFFQAVYFRISTSRKVISPLSMVASGQRSLDASAALRYFFPEINTDFSSTNNSHFRKSRYSILKAVPYTRHHPSVFT